MPREHIHRPVLELLQFPFVTIRYSCIKKPANRCLMAQNGIRCRYNRLGASLDSLRQIYLEESRGFGTDPVGIVRPKRGHLVSRPQE